MKDTGHGYTSVARLFYTPDPTRSLRLVDLTRQVGNSQACVQSALVICDQKSQSKSSARPYKRASLTSQFNSSFYHAHHTIPGHNPRMLGHWAHEILDNTAAARASLKGLSGSVAARFAPSPPPADAVNEPWLIVKHACIRSKHDIHLLTPHTLR